MPEKLPTTTGHRPSPEEGLGQRVSGNIEGVTAARELFWQNVIREMLTSLSVLGASKDKDKPVAVDAAGLPVPVQGDLFDGRLAVVTSLGQRIPIASVSPLFACGIQTSDADRALSMAVECTVFQINTPGGEVFTLPLHEIRGFHSLSEELIDQLNSASTTPGDSGLAEPFGFAAYTSLARTNLPTDAPRPSP
jgi:hypothetical protein